jgi:hypothetical protein
MGLTVAFEMPHSGGVHLLKSVIAAQSLAAGHPEEMRTKATRRNGMQRRAKNHELGLNVRSNFIATVPSDFVILQ